MMLRDFLRNFQNLLILLNWQANMSISTSISTYFLISEHNYLALYTKCFFSQHTQRYYIRVLNLIIISFVFISLRSAPSIYVFFSFQPVQTYEIFNLYKMLLLSALFICSISVWWLDWNWFCQFARSISQKKNNLISIKEKKNIKITSQFKQS